MEMSEPGPLFRLNIVFHKVLWTGCYEELAPEEIAAYIRFIGVNGKVTKFIPQALLAQVIHESELPWYNPFMQLNRFCESSAFFHAWRNPGIFLEQPYIGFFHYDMHIKKEAIEFLHIHTTAADAAGRKVVFAPYCHTAGEHLCQVIGFEGWDKIIGIYNAIHGTKHTVLSLLSEKIPLYHTFVIHKELFHQLMTFAEFVTPRLFEILAYDTAHLPFMLERMHGVFLTLRRIDGVTGDWLPLPGIVHEDALKDSWEKTPTIAGAS